MLLFMDVSESPATTELQSNSRQTQKGVHIRPGKPYPRGATWDGIGVNFALHSAHAEKVELLLFNDPDDAEPAVTFKLPEQTGPIWHGYVVNLRPGQLYGYRVYGPYDPPNGHRFNPNKVLLDPYAKAIGRPLRWDDSLFGYDVDLCTVNFDIFLGDDVNVFDRVRDRIDRRLDNCLSTDCQNSDLDIVVPIHQLCRRDELVSSENHDFVEPKQN